MVSPVRLAGGPTPVLRGEITLGASSGWKRGPTHSETPQTRLREALGAPAHEPRDRPRQREQNGDARGDEEGDQGPRRVVRDGRRGGHELGRGELRRDGRGRQLRRRRLGDRLLLLDAVGAGPAGRDERRLLVLVGLGRGLLTAGPALGLRRRQRVAEPRRVLLDVGRDRLAGVVDLVRPVAVVEPAVGLVVAEDLLEVVGRRARGERERRERDQQSGVGASASRSEGSDRCRPATVHNARVPDPPGAGGARAPGRRRHARRRPRGPRRVGALLGGRDLARERGRAPDRAVRRRARHPRRPPVLAARAPARAAGGARRPRPARAVRRLVGREHRLVDRARPELGPAEPLGRLRARRGARARARVEPPPRPAADGDRVPRSSPRWSPRTRSAARSRRGSRSRA